MFETAGQLSLAGVDPKAASESETRLNLGAVYTALLTNEIAFGRRVPIGELPRLSALELLNRDPRLVLLGDPGSGKSTFANFVALCLSGEALRHPEFNLQLLTAPPPAADESREKTEPRPQPWEHGVLLPVRVVLRDFAASGLPASGERATAKHLWDFIVSNLEAASLKAYAPGLKKELLDQGGLLLLDGLDEVPEAQQRRTQIKQAVEDFAATFGKCRFLVTSRTYAYQKQDWRLVNFAEAELAAFGAGQIRRFVERWYEHVAFLCGLPAAEAQGRAELLKRAIFNSDRLRGLAERPLLLTLMASLHAWRGGSLPEKREELYADTMDLLLERWERPKVVHAADGRAEVQQPSLAEWLKVDKDKVLGLLAELAFRAHAGQPYIETAPADIAEGDLVTGLMRLSRNPDVNPALLVNYLSERAGLLLPRGVGVYAFPHRTIQEYLAACFLTDHNYPDNVAQWVRQDFNRWREVALLAGAKAARGTLSAAWMLADALCFRTADDSAKGGSDLSESDWWGALLAAQVLIEHHCLVNISEHHQPKVKLVQERLTRIVSRGLLPPVDRSLAGDALAELGDPRGLEELVTIPAGEFWMGSNTETDPDASPDECPQREVELPAFKIGKYPVTISLWKQFVENTQYNCAPNACLGPDNHPAHDVSFIDACAFCEWLTARWRKADRISAHEIVRLPTEVEWEKAARGTDKRLWSWGNNYDPTCANVGETHIGHASTVGIFPTGSSPYGVLDMIGNVFEWTQTEVEVSLDERQDEPREFIRTTQGRVLRGGSYNHHRVNTRCAKRTFVIPVRGFDDWGFRVVVSTEPKPCGAPVAGP